MEVNKYLQHIIRKSSGKQNIHDGLATLQIQKREELNTYLFLVQKRLDLPTDMNPHTPSDDFQHEGGT